MLNKISNYVKDLKLEEQVRSLFKGVRFLDLNVLPELLPCGENGEDAFKWKTIWSCDVGLPCDRVIHENDLSKEQRQALSRISNNLGWLLIQARKEAEPVAWTGNSFSISLYEGSPEWQFQKSAGTIPRFETSIGFSTRNASGTTRKIVGVIQVKDSDLSISQVIENTIDMVDWMIVLDNRSEDQTLQIVERSRQKHGKIIVKDILSVHSGGRYLNNLSGTDTIVVKIDADEVWHPKFARDLRQELLTLDVGSHYKLVLDKGWFHVNSVSPDRLTCEGKFSGIPLYYFGNILAWPQQTERLHGLPIFLRDDDFKVQSLKLKTEHPIGQPPILHFPFLCLSSMRTRSLRDIDIKQKQRYISPGDKLVTVDTAGYEITEFLKSVMSLKD